MINFEKKRKNWKALSGKDKAQQVGTFSVKDSWQLYSPLTLVSWLRWPLCPRNPDGEAGLLDPPGLVLAQQVHQQQPPRQRRVQRGVAQPLQQIFLGWHKYFLEQLVSGVMKVRCVNVQMKVFWETPELLMAKSSAPECHECTIVAVSLGCSQPMVYALNMLYVSLSIHFPFLPVIIMKCLRV